jgi:hypothetical protein
MSDSVILTSESEIPLACYREIAAHLQQCEGVQVKLLPMPNDAPFDYDASQIWGLELHLPAEGTMARSRYQEILDYYAQQWGEWQTQEE